MAHDQTLVSIITPSYNKGQFIEETILSIQRQTYKNIEHIIIDSKSTDNTLPILKKYESGIIWISEPDDGQSDAINKGWRMAKGDIIAYLNADDTYLPDAVEVAVRYFTEHPDIGMIYGDGVLTDEHNKVLNFYHAGEFSLKNLIFCLDNILQPAVFLRKEVFETVGNLDFRLHLAMDLDYWIRIGRIFKVAYIPQPLATAKIYRDAKSVEQMHKYVKEYEHILEKFFSNSDLPSELAILKNDVYNYIYVKGGLDYIHLKMIIEGIKYLFKAIKISPILTLKNTFHLLMQYSKKNGGFKVLMTHFYWLNKVP